MKSNIISAAVKLCTKIEQRYADEPTREQDDFQEHEQAVDVVCIAEGSPSHPKLEVSGRALLL